MDAEPIVEQVSRPCEALQRRAHNLLNQVNGEFEDEDGDCANGFILADPIPQGSRKKHKLQNDCFRCKSCHHSTCLEQLATAGLSCSCLFCKRCFAGYADAMISCSIKEIRNPNFIDDSCYVPCPTAFCSGRFPLTDIQWVVPHKFREWEAALSDALVRNSGSFVNCPGCKVVIEKVRSELPPGLALSGVPEFDRTVPYTELDDEGRSLSRRAMLDKAINRFRCILCSIDFCGACLQSPYHLGKTCEEVQKGRQAIRCIYCDEVCRHNIESSHSEVVGSVKDIRAELEREGVDSGWCVEKCDLIAVKRLCDRVCGKKECRQRLKEACTRNLVCGHHCFGVRGERHCLPCVEESCQASSTESGSDCCGICLVEPLRSAPSIQMQCGHIVHFHCANRQIQEGYPGPHITFGHLKCPLCKKLMQHPHLDPYLHRHLAAMEEVKAKAIRRMRHDGSYDKCKAEASCDEKVACLALEQYQYYMCSRCNSPYFGGKRNCGQGRRDYDPRELVCGGCSAAGSEGACKYGHGKQYIEFKCRYCCSIATFFCFGSTHFCDNCHRLWPQQHLTPPQQCKGPPICPLGITHAPNGQEHCLGCSLCRSQEQL